MFFGVKQPLFVEGLEMVENALQKVFGIHLKAMGVAMSEHYAVILFGTLEDPAGAANQCREK